MATISAERISLLKEFERLAAEETLHVVQGRRERLVIPPRDRFRALLRGHRRAQVAPELEAELKRGLKTYSPDPEAPDYAPWADEPHLRPADA